MNCLSVAVLGAFLCLIGPSDALAALSVRTQAGDSLLPTARLLADRAYGVQKDQRLDVYIPEGAQQAPIVVMVHGGAWRIGDKRGKKVVENKGKHTLENGMIFVSVNYRMLPEVDPYGQARDVAEALAYVQAQAASWGGDPAKVVLMGHSAGAHLVALLSVDPHNKDWGGIKPWRGTVVLDSGALDVPEIMNRSHWTFYDRAFGKDPVFWEKTSPFHHLSGAAVPMLLVCSTKRPDKPCDQAQAFAQKAEIMGVKVGVLPEALPHDEVNETLGLEGDYTKAVDSFVLSAMK